MRNGDQCRNFLSTPGQQSIRFSMNPTLYFLSALGVATLVGLLLSGCAYLIIFQSPLFAHVNLEPTAINLELVNRTQSVNNSGEISS